MFKKRSLITLVSLLAILCVTVGGTLAYLVDTAGPVTNTFTPVEITTTVDEDTDNGVKTDVRVKNTGDADAYIRAAVVVTWQDASGNVYGKMPVEETDYSISFAKDEEDGLDGKWVKNGDYYYWTKSVAPENFTGILIKTCSYTANAPEGYSLAVEIIASGIQADGLTSDNKKPVVDVWGVDPETLS